MPRPRSAVAIAFATVGISLPPAAAQSAVTWTPCQPAGYECGRVAVPLDRSGAVPGTISLSMTRVPATQNPERHAVVTLAGGPGQAAIPIARSFAEVLSPALASRDLLVFDQRGTGGSGRLRCAALELSRGSLPDLVERCANEVGPNRAFYTTAQSVEDIEAVRAEAGYEKLVLYGVSYGTKVALDYAAAHPDRVEALVLDSVVTANGPDAFERSSLKAVPRVLRDLCAGGECRGISAAPLHELSRLAVRLRRTPLRGHVYDSFGRRLTAQLDEAGLVGILLAGDVNPTLRAELPGSVRAALLGDREPILRLSARSAGLTNAAAWQGATGPDSDALFFTTTCEDSQTLQWTRGAPRAQRAAEIRAAVRALPAATTAPFAPDVVLDGIPRLCLGYPVAAPPPPPPAAPPAVPTLLLDGAADLRTPLEDARAVAATIPGAVVVAIPHTGHSVLGADLTMCARGRVAAFFAAAAVEPCPASANRFSPTPRPPTSVNRLRPTPGTRGRVGRTIEALRKTLNDANRQVIGEALALGEQPAGVGGLRGGYLRVATDSVRLRGYEYVPGVAITGSLPDRGTATLRVGGTAGAHGRVRLTQGGRLTGTLDGIAVRGRFAVSSSARSRRAAPLTMHDAIARGRLSRAGR